jgi:cell filamentation protein
MDKATEPSASPDPIPSPNDPGEVIIGGAGLPVLPDRDASTGLRYLVSLASAREELLTLLDPARSAAIAQVKALTEAGAAPREIDRAYHDMAFLRHARGPMFQAMLLTALNHGKIEVVTDPKQTPLERVREIAVGLIIGINSYPRSDIERAAATLQAPRPPEVSAELTAPESANADPKPVRARARR